MNPDLRGVVLGLNGVAAAPTVAVTFAYLGIFAGLVVAVVAIVVIGCLGAWTDPDPERTQRARNLRRKS